MTDQMVTQITDGCELDHVIARGRLAEVYKTSRRTMINQVPTWVHPNDHIRRVLRDAFQLGCDQLVHHQNIHSAEVICDRTNNAPQCNNHLHIEVRYTLLGDTWCRRMIFNFPPNDCQFGVS